MRRIIKKSPFEGWHPYRARELAPEADSHQFASIVAAQLSHG